MTATISTVFKSGVLAAVVRFAAAAAAGALASVAFSVPAANWFLLVALALLFGLSVQKGSKREGFFIGWLWGLAFFAIGLRWCYSSLHDHGQLASELAVSGVVLLAAFLALFTGIVTWAVRVLPLSRRLKLIVLLPALWTSVELLRGVEPFGFGWLSVGYAYSSDFFGAWAPLIGVYGVGFVVALTVGLAVELLFPQQDKKPLMKTIDAIVLGSLMLGTLALNDVSFSQRGAKLEVRLVQPDLPVMMKYDPLQAHERIERVAAMSSRSALGAQLDLIVWPESTIAEPLRDGMGSPALTALEVARKTGASVIFNTFYREAPGRYYNALWMAQDNGRPAELFYRKHHLVPFGEFVPNGFRWFVDALGIPMADQLRGPVGGEPFAVAGVSGAAGICYENMFGEELRHAWDKANPGFILNTANLGWFSDAVLNQFTAMSAMRARETARPVIQAVQNAQSALIGVDGRVQRLAGKGAQNLDLTLVSATGTPTPFVRYGHGPVFALVTLLLLGCLAVSLRRKKDSDR